ncbi:MAG: DPP IV N-terminal domain-containing protein, partial [Acidobacteria bacterium]|nr:DPP IV N-terminal domain-containing protein [Acidobacteriota bacterium]
SLVFIGTKAGETWTTRREQIYTISTVTGVSRRLTADGNRYHLGSLAVTNDDSIVAVPYNRSSQIWVMDPNGDTRSAVQLTNGVADGRAGIAPMNDGRVAYLARTGENLTIWTMNPDGSDQKQLIRDPAFVEELRGSADGRYFVFASPAEKASQLFRVDTTGENLVQLTSGDVSAVDSTISPDGKWVAYTGGITRDNQFFHPLFRVSTDGGEPVRLTERDCITPHYSPDGKFISCIINSEAEMMIVTSEGAFVRAYPLKTRPMVNIGCRFTPDGKNLVYIVMQKDISNLWLQPIDGGKPRQLTNFSHGQIFNFAYSADGRRLFLARGPHQIQDAVLIRNFR